MGSVGVWRFERAAGIAAGGFLASAKIRRLIMRFCASWCARGLAVLTVIFAMAILAAPGWSQTFRGTILGTVTDSSGAAVADATVTVKNEDTGLVRTTVSTGD